MLNHSPTFRKWVNRIAIFSLSLGLLSMAIIFYAISKQNQANSRSCDQWLEETISPLTFSAVLLEIRQEDEKNCAFRLELSSETPTYLKACQCPNGENFIFWLEKGDSIFKKINERTLYVKKSDGRLRSFAYPCCE
ncbi:MAG: hypothetical protein MRZ79_20690 [Bacteroidia bacterium]|nr:hypothetical protein [Bacteroidia bacterium]